MKQSAPQNKPTAGENNAAISSRAPGQGGQGEVQPKKLAIDRSKIDWSKRPMYLRPYHPPYLVTYYGLRNERKSVKWNPLVARVENEPGLVVRIIEAYDDACAGCIDLQPDPFGSMWGAGYNCPSAQNPAVIEEVTRTNRKILNQLGLDFGAEIKFSNIVLLLEKNVPLLYQGIGGPANQAFYEKGLADLKAKYGLC